MEKPIEQPPSVLPAAVTLVVGLGDRGGRVVGGLERHPPFGPQDNDPRRHLGRLTLLHEADGSAGTDGGSPAVRDVNRHLAGQIVLRLEAMLAHESAEDARRREAERHQGTESTQALVLVVADAGEEIVRGTLAGLLLEIEKLAAERLSPLITLYRHGASKNLVVLPLLSTPHVPAAGAGAHIAGFIRDLHDQIAHGEPTRRLVSNLYVVEDVTDLSVLESADLDAILESFCLLLAEALGAGAHRVERSPVALMTDDPLRSTLRATQPEQPLGTFAVARVESGVARVREYMRCALALKLLDAVHDCDVQPEGLAGRNEVRANVRAVLERHPPFSIPEACRATVKDAVITPLPEPGWRDFKRVVLDTYEPDRGNPAVDDDRPAGEDAGWVKGAVDKVLGTWRNLIGHAFDGLVEQFRADLAEWEFGAGGRPGVRVRLQRLVDRALLPSARPTVASHREATRRATLIAAEARAVLHEAAAERDRCVIEDDPSVEPVRAAHAGLLAATRAVPSLRLLWAGCILTTLALTAMLAPALRALAAHHHFEPAGIGELLCQRHPILTVGLAAASFCALVGVLVFCGRYHRAREALRRLWQAADAVVLGPAGSVQSFFLGRLEHAWNLARVGGLVRACEDVERDLDRLRQVDRALVGAMDRYKQRLANIGVVRRQDGTYDATDLFSGMRQPLVWPLFDAGAVADFVARRQIVDLDAVLDAAEERDHLYSAWRQELPFLDDSTLDRALEGPVTARVPSPPWAGDDFLRSEAAKSLAGFARAQHRSLPVALPFRGHEHMDPDGILKVVDGVLLPEPYMELRQHVPEREALRGVPLATLGERAHCDRVYAVRIWNGIAPRTIDWWPGVRPAGERPRDV